MSCVGERRNDKFRFLLIYDQLFLWYDLLPITDLLKHGIETSNDFRLEKQCPYIVVKTILWVQTYIHFQRSNMQTLEGKNSMYRYMYAW